MHSGTENIFVFPSHKAYPLRSEQSESLVQYVMSQMTSVLFKEIEFGSDLSLFETCVGRHDDDDDDVNDDAKNMRIVKKADTTMLQSKPL